MREATLSPQDLIWPIFVHNEPRAVSIPSMPGVYRYSLSCLAGVVEQAQELGISALALFPCIDGQLKDAEGSQAYLEDSLIVGAIQAVNHARDKQRLGLIADVALDPYTSHGHDGLLSPCGTCVDNDLSIDALAKQALVLAKAGVDCLAPSDMMDGRVGALRRVLDEHNFTSTLLMPYAAKYASAFYGPFREAVLSKAMLRNASKATYQMDPANGQEALREAAMDVQEGADALIVKPGMCYLDVLHRVATTFDLPVFAYQVSGEFSMIKLAARHLGMPEEALILESLVAFKRAGARGVWTYFAPQAARMLQSR